MSNILRSGDSGPRRPLRIAAELEKEIPGLLRRSGHVPAELFLTVTGVEVTPDLSLARIYFSLLQAPRERGLALEKKLNAKRGEFRKEISQRLVMRQHPDLRFVYDETPERAARIEELLHQVREAGSGE